MVLVANRLPEGLACGRIVEVETYLGGRDPEGHACRGFNSPRTELSFRTTRTMYVYRTAPISAYE